MDKSKEFENAVKTILKLIGEDPNREGLEKTHIESIKLLNL